MQESRREFLRSLLQMAWADGELSVAEQEVLAGILAQLGFKPEEVAGEPTPQEGDPIAQLWQDIPDRKGRLQVMRDLVEVAFADRDLSLAEFAYLEKLAGQLEVSQTELMALIKGSIERSAT